MVGVAGVCARRLVENGSRFVENGALKRTGVEDASSINAFSQQGFYTWQFACVDLFTVL